MLTLFERYRFSFWNFKNFKTLKKGRKRENVEFVEAKVDASLGDIRENLRKSANQKHVSTSMVDPLKAMKKSGEFEVLIYFLKIRKFEKFQKNSKNSKKLFFLKDPNAHVSKRTHQLKYLVELAKANETRLNQLWSNAKSSSRSTAQKYGWWSVNYYWYCIFCVKKIQKILKIFLKKI